MKNPRETAWRVFASELNSAEYEIKAEEEKKPSYQLSRLGAVINRVLVAGVLTEKENVNTETEPMWKGRIIDPTGGSFYINVGKYQPEAAASMTDLEVPCLIAVVGKVKSYTTDEGRTWVSVRPERVVQIDDATRDEWLLDAAKSTWKRLVDMKKAMKQEDRSVDGLMASGLSEISARGISLAIEQYGMPDSSAHLKAIQSALRSLLPDKNIDLGLPEELADAPEEVEFDQGTPGEDSDDKEAIILQLLEDLDVDNKGAPRDQLEEQAAAKGISPMELEEISSSLMDKGLVYEPNLRYLKRI
ncbi:MAG: glycerol dehydrogenase [Candidatus Methanomethylophilus sp.]|jgi:RPA family protein|nr:glycerol dehydrogenase [Methanomethylophilus sp.]